MENKTLLKYRPDIDGLRAVAVIFVIIYHAFPNLLLGGFVGVDIFFVISGYLISGIILEELRKTNSFSFKNFYARRIRRIFPALILVLSSCLIAGWFILFASEYSLLGKNVAFGAGFIANIGYWANYGYFQVSSNLQPIIHLWSLGVEEQFYIFWPILLFLFYKSSKKIPSIIQIAILILLGYSFYLYYNLSIVDPISAFYLPYARFWELLVGAILSSLTFNNAFIIRMSDKVKKIIQEIFATLGIILISVPVYYINSNFFYVWWTVLVLLGVFLLIAAGSKTFINKYFFSNKVLVSIGLISYPLYLWHWPLLSFARIINGSPLSINTTIILVIVSFILAWLTYYFVERPVKKNKTKFLPIILLSTILIICALGIVVFEYNGFAERFPDQEKMLAPTEYTQNWIRVDIMKYIDGLFQSRININYVNNNHGPDIYADCEKYQSVVEPNQNKFSCDLSGVGKRDIFIVGDSHTRMVFDGYRDSLSKEGYRLIQMQLAGCSTLLDEDDILKYDPTPYAGSQIEDCVSKFKKVAELIKADNPAGIIISNNSWWSPDYNQIYIKIMNKTLSELPKNIPMIWFLQTPYVPFDLTKCLNRLPFFSSSLNNCSFPTSINDQFYKNYAQTVDSIKKDFPYVITIDPVSVLCNKNECPLIFNNQFAYWDVSHVSSFGGQYIASKLPITQYFPDLSVK